MNGAADDAASKRQRAEVVAGLELPAVVAEHEHGSSGTERAPGTQPLGE